MRFLTRKLVQPQDLNVRGTLFGGRLLAWVDEEAAIFAGVETRHNKVVTKSISAINFIAPAFQGENCRSFTGTEGSNPSTSARI